MRPWLAFLLISTPVAADDLSRHEKPAAGEKRCAVVTEGHTIRYLYRDAAGRVSRTAEVDVRDPKRPKPGVIHAVEYDSAGRPIKQTNDYDGDGKPNQIWTYRYDKAGRVTEMRHDHDADGKPEEGASYTYDGVDLAKAPIDLDHPEAELDTPSAFMPLRTSLAFQGVVTERYQKILGGSPYDWTSQFTYDAAGRRTRGEIFLNGRSPTGSPDRASTLRRDATGNLLAISNQPVDKMMGDPAYTWKAGRLHSVVSTLDGKERYRIEYTYDRKGRLIQQRNTQDGKMEVVDRRIAYECD